MSSNCFSGRPTILVSLNKTFSKIRTESLLTETSNAENAPAKSDVHGVGNCFGATGARTAGGSAARRCSENMYELWLTAASSSRLHSSLTTRRLGNHTTVCTARGRVLFCTASRCGSVCLSFSSSTKPASLHVIAKIFCVCVCLRGASVFWCDVHSVQSVSVDGSARVVHVMSPANNFVAIALHLVIFAVSLPQ